MVEIDQDSLPSAQGLSFDVTVRGTARGGNITKVTASVNGGPEQPVQTANKLPADFSPFSYTVAAVNSTTKYTVVVRAYNKAGYMGKNEASFSLSSSAPPSTLANPSNFKGTYTGSSIVLTWDAVPGAEAYELAEASAGGPVILSKATYTDTGLSRGSPYHYILKALKGGQKSSGVQITVDFSKPAPAPAPTPAPTPSTQPTPSSGGRMIWYNPQPRESMYTDHLTPDVVARINALPFDGITLMVRGVSWESMRAGYSLNSANLLAQLHKADGIKKKKGLLLLTSWPASPSDTAAWNKMIQVQGQIAAAMRQVDGWATIFHDNEPYQDPYGNQLGDMWWDKGWWMLFRNDERIRGYYRQMANTLSANYPGLHYAWYHGPYVGDYSSQGWVTAEQTGNAFGGARLAFFGMLEAIAQDGANLVLHDGGESYNGRGKSFYLNSADYRSYGILKNVSDLSPAARAIYSQTVQIDFGRMRGSATTTSASSVTQELNDLWPALTAQGYVWYYVEDDFLSIGSGIVDGVAAFQASAKPQASGQHVPFSGSIASQSLAPFVPNHSAPVPPQP
ncbi:MAG: hypothetical protein C4331_10165 [Meiothermus sp.]